MFECLECTKSFPRKDRLPHHVKVVHQKLKSFKCQTCTYVRGRNCELKSHMDTVHRRLKKFACQIYDAKFGRRYAPSCHMKSVHEGVQEHLWNLLESFFLETLPDGPHRTCPPTTWSATKSLAQTLRSKVTWRVSIAADGNLSATSALKDLSGVETWITTRKLKNTKIKKIQKVTEVKRVFGEVSFLNVGLFSSLKTYI